MVAMPEGLMRKQGEIMIERGHQVVRIARI